MPIKIGFPKFILNGIKLMAAAVTLVQAVCGMTGVDEKQESDAM